MNKFIKMLILPVLLSSCGTVGTVGHVASAVVKEEIREFEKPFQESISRQVDLIAQNMKLIDKRFDTLEGAVLRQLTALRDDDKKIMETLQDIKIKIDALEKWKVDKKVIVNTKRKIKGES